MPLRETFLHRRVYRDKWVWIQNDTKQSVSCPMRLPRFIIKKYRLGAKLLQLLQVKKTGRAELHLVISSGLLSLDQWEICVWISVTPLQAWFCRIHGMFLLLSALEFTSSLLRLRGYMKASFVLHTWWGLNTPLIECLYWLVSWYYN